MKIVSAIRRPLNPFSYIRTSFHFFVQCLLFVQSRIYVAVVTVKGTPLRAYSSSFGSCSTQYDMVARRQDMDMYHVRAVPCGYTRDSTSRWHGQKPIPETNTRNQYQFACRAHRHCILNVSDMDRISRSHIAFYHHSEKMAEGDRHCCDELPTDIPSMHKSPSSRQRWVQSDRTR